MILGLASVPGGLAVCAITHPGGIAIFTNVGYRTWIGWWTTGIAVIVLNALIALVAWLVVGGIQPWTFAAFFAGAVVVGHMVGLMIYYLVGELFVSIVLVATARARAVPLPLERLAASLVIFFLLALGASAGASLTQPQGGSTGRTGVSDILGAVFRFEGTPQEQLFQWMARANAVALIGSIVWLLALARRREPDHAPPRHAMDS